MSPINNRDNISNLPAEVFASLLSGPLVEISVGPERKRWHVHLNLLRHHSSFFSDSTETEHINGEVKVPEENKPGPDGEKARSDDKDRKLDISDEDPGAFRILVKWLYQGRIDHVSTFPPEQMWDYTYTCQNLYLLAHRLSIPNLCNLAIDQFRHGCNLTRLVPGADEIKPVYRRTPLGSPFRELVSRIAARQLMDPDLERDAACYAAVFMEHPEFAVDVLNAIREATGGSPFDDPTEGNGCRYHEHSDKQEEGCVKSVRFGEGVKG